MSTRMTLLGRPQVEHEGRLHGMPDERRCRLLALLALRREWVARGELAALFWPGLRHELAATNLRKAVHFARALPWAGALESQAGRLRFVVSTDVHNLDAAMREGRIVDALEYCRGSLLDGMDDSSNQAWTDWLDAERAQQTRRWHELTRTRLAQLEGEPEQAAGLARRLLDVDPLDEDAMVALLAAQRTLGRFDEQCEAYRHFAMRLEEELGIEPSLRVRRLLQGSAPLQLPTQAATPLAPGDGFFGRKRELEELPALLARDACRLLTVLGPGGVGKSSLMKRALRRIEPLFADGVFWIALDDLVDTAQVATRIATELRLTPAPQQQPLALIRLFLATRRTLLVLDNAEHLAGLARFARQLLDDTERLKICVTSRSRLAAQGEWLLPLAGLALPAPQATAADVLASDAAHMFLASAAVMRPDFDAPGQAAAIGALVRATGGLPLAILLASHWVRLLPVAEIVAELEHSLDVLDSGDDEGEERPEHRSMYATFEHSWQMLATREQRSLAELSVFVGTFSLQAAREVAGAVLPLLAALSDKSLLTCHGGGRFSLHPLIRQFAAEKLAPDALAQALQRHALWFHGLLARAGPEAEAGNPHTLDDIGQDLENCRLAWGWAIAQGAIALLAASAPAWTRYFDQRNRASEGEASLRESLPLCGAAGVDPAHAATLLSALAHLQCRLYRLDAAAAHARQGIKLARLAGSTRTLSRCLRSLGVCHWHWGHNLQAMRFVEQSLRHAQAVSDEPHVLMARMFLAVLKKALGHYGEARDLLLQGLAQERERGNFSGAAFHLVNLAGLQYQLGVARLQGADWQAARRYLDEGQELCEAHDLAYLRPLLLLNRLLVEYHDGDLAAAEQIGRQALALAQSGGVGDVEVVVLLYLARIALRRSWTDAARNCLGKAVDRATGLCSARLKLACVLCFGEAIAADGDSAGAASLGRYFLVSAEVEPIERAMARQTLAGIDIDGAVPIAEPLDALIRRLRAELASAAA